MYEFELATIAGEMGQPGQILNLYEGQPFQLQVIAAEPHKMLTIANLPLTFQGEYGTGVGIFTLHAIETGTEVAITAARRYTWPDETSNPLQERRASAAFQAQTRVMWQDKFLARLKALVEEPPTD